MFGLLYQVKGAYQRITSFGLALIEVIRFLANDLSSERGQRNPYHFHHLKGNKITSENSHNFLTYANHIMQHYLFCVCLDKY